MIDRFDWNSLDESERTRALARPAGREDPALLEAVRAIVDDIRRGGWDALVAHAEAIDGAAPECLDVAPFADRARRDLDSAACEAIELAARNITEFHRRTRPSNIAVETMPGLVVTQSWRAIGSAGLYVPGGRAPLFSTLLMLALPARAANVGRICVVTPPRSGGGLDPALALAAEHAGIAEVWTVGGAQAIAALAFGAGPIARVDRIYGPGNAWVAAAKALVASLPGGPGIDLPAGPSELMVVAGAGADPATVAADLISQAEHDPAAQVILVTAESTLADDIVREFVRQADEIGAELAPARAICCADTDEAITIANRYGAEHLSLALDAAEQIAERVTSAGAVFVGHAAAESFGDYLAGSSHVLPTDGAARFTGGVTTASFMKPISIQRVTREAAARLAGPAAILARLEGLEGHARAAELRKVPA